MNKYFEEHKHEFFTYNGAKYYFGTKFKMKIKHEYGFDQIVNALFKGDDCITKGHYAGKFLIGYNTPLDEAEDYRFRSGLQYRNWISMTEEELQEAIVEILPGNYEIEMETRKKYWKDTDDLNLMAKWGMYIFAMLWTSIMNGRFFGWIALTVIFFVWRRRYKEENCVYYE